MEGATKKMLVEPRKLDIMMANCIGESLCSDQFNCTLIIFKDDGWC
jgi:hypothetical protein